MIKKLTSVAVKSATILFLATISITAPAYGKTGGCRLDWVEEQATPFAPDYIPQGLANDDEGLILSAYSKTNQPAVRFFRQKHGKWLELAGDTRPLLHTSGIIAHGGSYFLIDYDSGLIAKANIGGNKIRLTGKWDTGNGKISSGFMAERDGEAFLVVSQFGMLGRYHWYRVADLTAENGVITPAFTTSASAFIQGNTTHDGIVVEASNSLGTDKLSFLKQVPSGAGLKVFAQVKGPGPMIEDVVVYRDRIYTTDEERFLLYSAPFHEACKR